MRERIEHGSAHLDVGWKDGQWWIWDFESGDCSDGAACLEKARSILIERGASEVWFACSPDNDRLMSYGLTKAVVRAVVFSRSLI